MVTAPAVRPWKHVTRPCQSCGTWTCAACGWWRRGASRDRPEIQACAQCGGTSGTYSVIRHYKNWIWESHNLAQGPRCRAWAAKYNPNLLEECQHESCQVIGWGHVIRKREARTE